MQRCAAMQTFLPYYNFHSSAQVLDSKRLGKQRVEAYQILRALEFGPYQYHNGEEWVACETEAFRVRLGDGPYRRTPWYNHPATQMWLGYERALATYGYCMCLEWRTRWFKDSLLDIFWLLMPDDGEAPEPPWLRDPAFHRSHQSNLVRKDPVYYRRFFPDVPDNLPYVWPSHALLR